MILGVDIDLTFVDTGRGWFNWLRDRSELVVPDYDTLVAAGEKIPYDLSSVFTDIPPPVTLDYWRPDNLYDNMEPLPHAVEALRSLKEEKGYKIVFVSTIKGDHHKSKYYMVEHHVPFLDGFIATKEKHFARVDVMIDDRLNVLEKMDKTPVRIQMNTPFDQYTTWEPTHKVDNWLDLQKLMHRYY